MMQIIYIILAFFLGIIAGTLTGLLPGLHVNIVSAVIISSLTFLLLHFSPLILVVFIVSMTLTNTFLSFIPSIFLGAPDEDTVLSVLPGHQMLNKGKGYEAVIMTLYGGVIGIAVILLLLPLFIFIFPEIYPYLKVVMFFILVFTSIYLFIREKNSRILGLIVFFLAGFLGLATINLSLKESLLPLLTGLFGSSSLITSIMKKQKIPRQKITKISRIKIKKKEIINSFLAAVLSAPLCSFLPALGSGQAAIIGSDIVEEVKGRQFLVLLGGINVAIAGLSFITLYSLHESRTGTAVAIENLLSNFSFQYLLIILAVIIVSSVISFFLTISISKFFTKRIFTINYTKISLIVLAFLCLVVLIFSGFIGFFIFITATFTGLIAILAGVRRTHLMGCLMLPAILLYLPF